MTQTRDNNPGRMKLQQLLAAIGSKAGDDSMQIESVEYDWHQPHFFNNQQMKKLAVFTSKMAALIAQKFGALCQKICEVKITSTSEHFAGQFLGQEPAGQTQGPGNYYLPFSTGQKTPCGFVSIPPQTAIVWTTQLLGDTESKEKSIRPLSDLESSLLFDIASLIVEAIKGADEKCSFHPAADNMTNTLPLQLKGSEEFCQITFQVKKEDSEADSEAHILILCDKLAPVVCESAQTEVAISAKETALAMQEHIEEISVPISAQLACVPVSVEQMLNLADGDILLLDKKVDEPIELHVAGRILFRGRCAKSAGKYALAVTEAFFTTA